MKQIFGIAKTELQVLFFSPIAWFILIVFMVQAAMSYFGTVDSFAATLSDGGGVSDVTYKLLVQRGFNQTLFTKVLGTLFYYIPLLTMGIMSRELSSGSIKLLFSSPVNNAQIVLGKFVAVAIYGLLMIFILFLFVLQGAAITVENFDWAIVPVGLLGIYLLICAYSAVGIFMSSITSYQMVAMLSTLVILSFFSYVGGFWQDVAFVRDITYWLSMNGRAGLFTTGVFCTEDFIYFITVVYLFLSLAILRLRVKREKLSRAAISTKYLTVFAVVVAIAFISSRPIMKKYIDATRFERHTLTKSSQEIISQLEGEYTVTTYSNIYDRSGVAWRTVPRYELEDLNDLMGPYTRFKPDLKIKYKYYASTKGERYAYYKKYFPALTDEEIFNKVIKVYSMQKFADKVLTEEEMLAIEPMVAEDNFQTIKIIDGPTGKKGIIRYFNDMIVKPTESEISATFKRMITEVYPKVAFITGHDERSIYDDGDLTYTSFTSKYIRSSLYNQGFDVIQTTLDKPIADDVNIVVIADPREDYTDAEFANYQEYIARGGNLIVLGEPMRTDKVDKLMGEFGYKMADGRLVMPKKGSRADFIAQKPTIVGGEVSYFIEQLRRDGRKRISTPSATYLEKIGENDYNERVVMASDTTGGQLWNELQTRYFEEFEPDFNPETGEQIMDKAPMAIALDREVEGKTQKIMLIADADVFSNQELSSYPHRGISADNPKFITGIFEWMSDGVSPIDMRRPAPIDNRVKISVDGATRVKYFFMWGIPLMMLIAGLVINIRRRSK